MGFESGFELRDSSNNRFLKHGLVLGYLGRCRNSFDKYIIKHGIKTYFGYDCENNMCASEDMEFIITAEQLHNMVVELRPLYEALNKLSDRVLVDIENYESGYDNISDKDYRKYSKELDLIKDALYYLGFETEEYSSYKYYVKVLNSMYDLEILDNEDLKLIYWRSW